MPGAHHGGGGHYLGEKWRPCCVDVPVLQLREAAREHRGQVRPLRYNFEARRSTQHET